MDSAFLASHLVKLCGCLICLLPEVDASRGCKWQSPLNAAVVMNDTGLLSVADLSSKTLCCCKTTGYIGGLFGRTDPSTCQLYEELASCPGGTELKEGECGDWQGKFNPANSSNLFHEVREELAKMGVDLSSLNVELSLNVPCYPGIFALAKAWLSHSPDIERWRDAILNFIPAATDVHGDGKKCLISMSDFVDKPNGMQCSWRETMDINMKNLLGASMGVPEAGVTAGIPGWRQLSKFFIRLKGGATISDQNRVEARAKEVQEQFGSVSQMRRGYRAYLTMAVAHEFIHCADSNYIKPSIKKLEETKRIYWYAHNQGKKVPNLYKKMDETKSKLAEMRQLLKSWSSERHAMLMEQTFILEMIAGGDVPEDWAELYEQVNTAIYDSFSEDIRTQIDDVWGKEKVAWTGDISMAASALFNKHYGHMKKMPVWLAIYTRFRREHFDARPPNLRKGDAMEAVKGVLMREKVPWASRLVPKRS